MKYLLNASEITNKKMNHFKLLVLVIGLIHCSGSNSTLFTTMKNEDGTWNVTCDCSHHEEKELTLKLWNSTFPDDLYTLTIANCHKLDILVGQHHKKRNFSELIVNNVDFCKIAGAKDQKLESSLPRLSFFTNVKSLTIDVPLYQTIQDSNEYFIDGVLHFSNMTIENLIPRAIQLEKSSLKKFYMSEVYVKNASENAISFHGNNDSVLEIRNSFFNKIPNNFIKCNVTNVKIWKNKFGNLRQGSFHFNSENVYFTGNTIDTVEGYGIKISPSTIDLLRNNDFKGFALDDTLPHAPIFEVFDNKERDVDEIDLKLGEGYFVNGAGGMKMKKQGENCYGPSTSKFLKESPKYPKINKISIFSHVSENVYLLWFLSISFLTLLFPIAYFIKIYLCDSIEKKLPAEVKHQPLINIDDS